MNQHTIKKTYHDALYFASSPNNDKQPWYLNPSEFKILIKLIHYSSENEEITFQNKDIAKHTYLSEYTIKNGIKSLYRKGYLNHQLDVFNNHLGYASKRTITINWSRLEEILNLSTNPIIEAEAKPAVLGTPIIKDEVTPQPEKKVKENSKEASLIRLVNSKSISSEDKKMIIEEITINKITSKEVYELIDNIQIYSKL